MNYTLLPIAANTPGTSSPKQRSPICPACAPYGHLTFGGSSGFCTIPGSFTTVGVAATYIAWRELCLRKRLATSALPCYGSLAKTLNELLLAPTSKRSVYLSLPSLCPFWAKRARAALLDPAHTHTHTQRHTHTHIADIISHTDIHPSMHLTWHTSMHGKITQACR